MENIIIQQPQPFDLVDNTIMISGIGTGFKGTLTIHIGDGDYKIDEYAQVGAYSLKQFQAKVTIPENIEFKLDKISLIVRDNSAKNNKVHVPTIVIPLIYAPNILPDYSGFWLHKVDKNETLATLAKKYYQDKNKWEVIYRSNIDRISNPDTIYPGQILRIPKNEEF